MAAKRKRVRQSFIEARGCARRLRKTRSSTCGRKLAKWGWKAHPVIMRQAALQNLKKARTALRRRRNK